jgi:hypothetical protein
MNKKMKLADNGNQYNEEYFESGVKSGISGYESYRWMPTRSFEEAITLVNHFEFNSILDYGCAKGYLVRALRKLGKDAFGEDISEYAINSSHEDTRSFLSFPTNARYDMLVCKDVLEHVPYEEVGALLASFKNRSSKQFLIVPLADNNLYRIREYEIDRTHVIRENEEWWLDIFAASGLRIEKMHYCFGAFKQKWYEVNPHGNAFFELSSES